MSGNTPGARCLNKHLNKEKTKTSGTCDYKVGVSVDVSVTQWVCPLSVIIIYISCFYY